MLYRREPLPAINLSAVSRTEDYEDIEMGHEYEVLSKYSEAYEEVKPSQEIQKTSRDYEFSQCPAYGATSAMAHSTPVVSGSDDKSGIVVGGEGPVPEKESGQGGGEYANIQT